MAENGLNIDDLKIKISVDAKEASNGLKDLASQLRNVGASAKSTNGSLRDVAKEIADMGKAHSSAATQIGKLDDTLTQVGESAEEAGEKADKASKGGLSNFFAAVKRIAVYRLIRSAIKAIITALGEGLNMFVTWDRDVNGSMAGAATAVDRLKSATEGLKGSLGVFLGGILTQIEPILTRIVNIITEVIDVFQQLSRLLQGYHTYFKYVYQGARAASGAAKELKRVLFGFDELNILPSQSGGGVSGSGGYGTYVETPIEWENLGEFWSDLWSTLKDVVKKGWETFQSWFSPIWEAAQKKWSESVEKLKQKISDLWQKVPEKWRVPIENTIKTVDTYFVYPLKRTIQAIEESFGYLIYFITHPSNWTTEGWDTLCNNLKTVWNTAMLDIAFEWQKTENKIKGGTDELKNRGITNFNVFKDGAQGAIDELNRKWNGFTPKTLYFKALVNSSGLAKDVSDTYEKLQTAMFRTPFVFTTSTGTISNSTVSSRASQLAGVFNTKGFASGGMPDTGTLFYAGEAGAEVVANMGHSTGVMNMSQMQEAVASGNIEVVNAVYAMANMVAGAINNKDFDVYMDTQKVGQSVSKYQFNQARRGITQGGY